MFDTQAVKMEEVHTLEEHLAESRPLHSPTKTKGIDLKRELYAQSTKVRLVSVALDASSLNIHVIKSCMNSEAGLE